MAHVRKDAFIWTRQFTHQQLQRLNRVQSARQWLDSKTIDLSRFARCQLQDTDKRYNVYHTFDGVWDGKPAYIELRLRPLFINYAVAVYAQVIAEAHVRYPGFTRYHFDDGPWVGERRVAFPDRLDDATSAWMFSRFWRLAESGVIQVKESFRAYWHRNGAIVGGWEHLIVEIALDRLETRKEVWSEVADIR